MRRTDCDRERDALEAVSRGRWPDGAGDDLRSHVARCPACTELVAVAVALQDDRRKLVRDAPVLRAEVAWWRAERRAREEAARAATRPIALAHAAAVVCAGVAAAALLGLLFSWLGPWLRGMGDLNPAGDTAAPALFDAASIGPWVLPLAVGVGAWLVLVPVALYFSVTDR